MHTTNNCSEVIIIPVLYFLLSTLALLQYVGVILTLSVGRFRKFDFQSPPVDISEGCFHFSYRAQQKTNMYLSDMGRLFVSAVPYSNTNNSFPVWSKNLYYGSDWTDVEVEIELSPNRYQVTNNTR